MCPARLSRVSRASCSPAMYDYTWYTRVSSTYDASQPFPPNPPFHTHTHARSSCTAHLHMGFGQCAALAPCAPRPHQPSDGTSSAQALSIIVRNAHPSGIFTVRAPLESANGVSPHLSKTGAFSRYSKKAALAPFPLGGPQPRSVVCTTKPKLCAADKRENKRGPLWAVVHHVLTHSTH